MSPFQRVGLFFLQLAHSCFQIPLQDIGMPFLLNVMVDSFIAYGMFVQLSVITLVKKEKRCTNIPCFCVIDFLLLSTLIMSINIISFIQAFLLSTFHLKDE